MRTILCIIAIAILQSSTFAQQRALPDSFLLKKSKDQKTAAYITLGIGTATMLPGIIMLSNQKPGLGNVDWQKVLGGTALIGVGVSCLTASIILFTASKRNENKAYDPKLTMSLNKPVEVMGLPGKYMPYSVGLNIAIR
jgi:hypothetical protein